MPIDLTKKEVEAIYREIKAQTDRGAAIIAAAILEDALTDALKNRLILTSNLSERIFSHEKNGPLAHFSGKIDMAAATGLAPKEMCDCFHLVRRIRNKFAHSIEPLKFSDTEISAWTRSLKCNVEAMNKISEPRARYTIFAVVAASSLLILKNMRILKIAPVKDLPPSPDLFLQFFHAFFRHVVDLKST